MDELPKGRQKIETHVVFPKEREHAYSAIRGQIDAGHQAFIIYPLV
jgi:ATP-dependent DNA helicase RecG